MSDSVNPPASKPRYLWPWLLAAMVVVGVVLAVLSIRHEAQRLREQRQLQVPSAQ